jgi:hypothetical protein
MSSSHLDIFIFLLPSKLMLGLNKAKEILTTISIRSIIIVIIFLFLPLFFKGL